MRRDTIDVLPNDVVDTISCGEVKRVAVIDVKTWMDHLPALNDSRATSVSLTVGKMKQPQGSNYCWAVCAAVIINKIAGGSWSYSQIASMFKVANPTGGDQGASIKNVIYDRNNYFSANYAVNNTTQIAPVYVIEHLLAGYPIYGSYSNPNASIGHATVIRGVNSLLNTYSMIIHHLGLTNRAPYPLTICGLSYR